MAGDEAAERDPPCRTTTVLYLPASINITTSGVLRTLGPSYKPRRRLCTDIYSSVYTLSWLRASLLDQLVFMMRTLSP